MCILLFLEYPLATPSWQPCFDTVPIKNVWLQQRDHVGCGVLLKLSGNASRLFQIGHCLAQNFELSNHDCRHATPFISEASSFTNNIPATFRVCGTKSCGIRFSRPLQAFGSECMSVFYSCGFLIFKPPRGCDYLHQGAPKFPSNLLCKSSFFSVKCSNPSGCGIPYPRATGFRSRAAAKLPNPGGNEVSESMGLEVSESKLGQVSESGRL